MISVDFTPLVYLAVIGIVALLILIFPLIGGGIGLAVGRLIFGTWEMSAMWIGASAGMVPCLFVLIDLIRGRAA